MTAGSREYCAGAAEECMPEPLEKTVIQTLCQCNKDVTTLANRRREANQSPWGVCQ